MAALEQSEVLGLSTQHVRGGRKQSEVLGGQWRFPIRSGERLVRIRPRLGRIGRTPTLEFGRGIHYWADYRGPRGPGLLAVGRFSARLGTPQRHEPGLTKPDLRPSAHVTHE